MDTVEAVRRAADNDQAAWDTLVERFTGLLWWIAHSYGLSSADAADVVQTAWARLVERLDSLHEPDRVGAWLATTTRRECSRLLRNRARVVLFSEDAPEPCDRDATPDAAVLARERDTLLWHAVAALPEQRQHLVRALLCDPPLSYDEISKQLDIPIGSIGPTRARCLGQLRQHLEAVGVEPPQPTAPGEPPRAQPAAAA